MCGCVQCIPLSTLGRLLRNIHSHTNTTNLRVCVNHIPGHALSMCVLVYMWCVVVCHVSCNLSLINLFPTWHPFLACYFNQDMLMHYHPGILIKNKWNCCHQTGKPALGCQPSYHLLTRSSSRYAQMRRKDTLYSVNSKCTHQTELMRRSTVCAERLGSERASKMIAASNSCVNLTSCMPNTIEPLTRGADACTAMTADAVAQRPHSHDGGHSLASSYSHEDDQESARALSPPQEGAHILSPPQEGAHILSLPQEGAHILSPPQEGAHILSLPQEGAHILSPPQEGAHTLSPPQEGVLYRKCSYQRNNYVSPEELPRNVTHFVVGHAPDVRHRSSEPFAYSSAFSQCCTDVGPKHSGSLAKRWGVPPHKRASQLSSSLSTLSKPIIEPKISNSDPNVFHV